MANSPSYWLSAAGDGLAPFSSVLGLLVVRRHGVLTGQQGQALDQSTDTAGAHHWWKLVPVTSGYHRLVNVKSGMCVDAQNGYTADGTPLIQWPPNTGSNQEWQIVPV